MLITTPDTLSPQMQFLAIDQGGHSTRTLVFNARGEIMAEGKKSITTQYPHADWAEQDPEEMLDSITTSVQKAVAQLGDNGANIFAAGMATQRSSLVCWDRESGEALTPIISWQDRRAADWLHNLGLDNERVHRETGLFVTAHYGASKFRWCLDNIPAVQKAHADGRLLMGPMASFLVYRLLREKPIVADPANASRTQLWNIRTRDWDEELMAEFDLPLACFPTCVPTEYAYGNLVLNSLEIPFTILNGDQSASMFAFGEIQPDTAYINVGTGAFVSRSSGNYARLSRRLLTSVVFQDESDSIYVMEGTVNGAASALDWVEEKLALPPVQKQLPQWLAEDCEPPLFINGIGGLGAPYWVAHFPSHFIGEAEPWLKVVAVVESIVFLILENLSEMQKQASPPLRIQITGGLAGLDGLCQRLADLSGLPIYRPAEKEATARGLAYLMANCPHEWPEADIGDWFKPGVNSVLQARYQRWQQAMLSEMRHK